MPFYQKRGEIPNKRHIQFRDSKKNLYWEELISRGGFSNIYSNVYHLNPPTGIEVVGKMNKIKINVLYVAGQWLDVNDAFDLAEARKVSWAKNFN